MRKVRPSSSSPSSCPSCRLTVKDEPPSSVHAHVACAQGAQMQSLQQASRAGDRPGRAAWVCQAGCRHCRRAACTMKQRKQRSPGWGSAWKNPWRSTCKAVAAAMHVCSRVSLGCARQEWLHASVCMHDGTTAMRGTTLHVCSVRPTCTQLLRRRALPSMPHQQAAVSQSVSPSPASGKPLSRGAPPGPSRCLPPAAAACL